MNVKQYFTVKDCQVNSWNHHKNLCQAINHLQQQNLANISKEAFNIHLLMEKAKLVNVIGGECSFYCKLSNYYCKSLLDTGAQVSLLSKGQLQRNISKFEIFDLREFHDDSGKLRVQWRNIKNITLVEWVNIEIQLDGSHMALSNVAFLVTSDYMERPLLRFNVIGKMLQNSIVNILTKSLRKSSKVQAIFKSM